MNEKTLRVEDEHGNEFDYEILFTFTSEETQKSYVVYKEQGDSDEVFAAIYTEDGEGGNLLPIETDEEWDMVEEKLEEFLDEHEHDYDHDHDHDHHHHE